jgi:hypothetical protein
MIAILATFVALSVVKINSSSSNFSCNCARKANKDYYNETKKKTSAVTIPACWCEEEQTRTKYHHHNTNQDNDHVITLGAQQEQRGQVGKQLLLHQHQQKGQEEEAVDDLNDDTRGRNPQQKIQLDFAIVGFAKTGTTSLRTLLQHHEQTTIPDNEKCYRTGSDEEMKRLFQELGKLPNKSNFAPTLRGIKCPSNVIYVDGLQKMKDYKNDTKLIVGIRHPVRWFESFYNFRVAVYNGGRHRDKPPPSPHTLLGKDKKYLGLNTDIGRFELSLMQLGKTELNTTDLLALAERKRRVIQSPFPVLIYTVEQLKGGDQEEAFRKDLQTYLQVQYPFGKIPRANSASERQGPLYNNTSYLPIDICEEQYINIRNELVKNGKGTADWLLNHFVKHSDVMIGGNDDVFMKIVQGFATDPCSLQQ